MKRTVKKDQRRCSFKKKMTPASPSTNWRREESPGGAIGGEGGRGVGVGVGHGVGTGGGVRGVSVLAEE
jgi:hypothetical protein